MSPKVGVGMNDRTIRNIEDFAHRDGKKGEGTELGVLLEVIIGVTADEHGSPIQSSQAFEC